MTGPEAMAGGSVLVLDDEPLVTRSLEGLLKMETPWTVFAFNRPQDAAESLAERAYDAAIADFLMPEMDGLAFLKCVRDSQPFASRILLTGYADKGNAIRSINEVGLFQYVEKPWDNDALLLVIRNAVERARTLRRVDDLVRQIAERDRSLEGLRAGLLKAIV
jgi:DNA-binding NtrC family response regulator